MKAIWIKAAIVALFMLALSVVSAEAGSQRGFGLRGGMSIDPDQVYFGMHTDAGPVADRLWFRPNVEVGVGDHLTLISMNGEFAYWLPRSRSQWQAYVGGGPAINLYSWRGDAHDSEMQAGLNFMLGCAHRDGLFVEFKVGAFDSPELRFGIGYTFR
ncbi:MAG: hypothetical protein MUF51_07760 [Vicinamibacteria bacterium]|jgi:hypothetical protein|nr:hypothetical protein [Vicinamibacteria bacterium]